MLYYSILKKRTERSCPSLTETDGSLGPWALRSCPLLLEDPGGGTVQDGKKQKINSLRPQAYLRVCVSCVASIYARVCSSVSCVPFKTLIKIGRASCRERV